MKTCKIPLSLAVIVLHLLLGGSALESMSQAKEPASAGQTGSSLAGKWSGSFTTPRGRASLEIRFTAEGGPWKGTGTVTFDADRTAQDSVNARNIVWMEGALTFTTDVRGAEVVFSGKLTDGKLAGNLVIQEGGQKLGDGTWALSRAAGATR